MNHALPADKTPARWQLTVTTLFICFYSLIVVIYFMARQILIPYEVRYIIYSLPFVLAILLTLCGTTLRPVKLFGVCYAMAVAISSALNTVDVNSVALEVLARLAIVTAMLIPLAPSAKAMISIVWVYVALMMLRVIMGGGSPEDISLVELRVAL